MRPEVYREMAAVQKRHWWFVARRRILASVIGALALPPRAEILEIGCGTGANLAMLSAFGRLSAMECDDHARAIAADLRICPIVAGGLPEPVPAFLDDGHFDLVCLLDVLEHIDDDRAGLARAGRLLKPTGRLLVTVPAYAWLWSAHDDAHHHRRRYTAGMLRQRVRESGLTVARLGYFNSLLFPLVAGIRTAKKLDRGDRGREGQEGSDAAMPSAWINALLSAVFGMERYVVPRTLFPFGTSVMAILSSAK
jgi:SAM-dependent methyltransferase